MSQSKFIARLLCTSMVTLAWAGTVGVSNAQEAAAEGDIVVSGSRIVREGYSAPTPLSVLDPEMVENRPDPNITVTLVQLPAFGSGGSTAQGQSGGLSSSTSGQSSLNLRNLGNTRTLVLIDGQRTVGSSASGQNVDISSYPQQLIQRVDIVTGGASAVYGSDAVAGVVNFVLDKNFTGLKGDIGGGITNYGDMKNFQVRVSGGFDFAGGRGHILLSGEESFNEGIKGDGGREWNRTGAQILTNNPAYTATNGVPQTLNGRQVGQSGGTPGGIVLSGPLKGLAFGEGGVPFQFNYGSVATATQNMGGDWYYTDRRAYTDQMAQEHRQNLFFRGSYDITNNINAHFQTYYTKSRVQGNVSPPYLFSTQGPFIQRDNAFLPQSVRDRMIALNLTQFQIGSFHTDLGQQYADNTRTTYQSNAGLNGNFEAFGTEWNWEANGSIGISKPNLHFYNTFSRANYNQAIDAVINPATGAIVCRVKLTDPTSQCQPFNPLGTGVNGNTNTADSGANIGAGNNPGVAWIKQGGSSSDNRVEQQHYTASIAGEPFSLWAGPVSLALSAEHRLEKVLNTPDPVSAANGRNAGNLPILDGQQSVTEAAIETVIPLIASGGGFVDSWDVSGAARFTDYELAGQVTTWKVGSTFAPTEDIKLRVTRSRDIRAPNLQELFQPSAFSVGTLTDPFTNSSPSVRQFAHGNVNLDVEKADTLGVGVVLTPRFLPGFAFSADYFKVDLIDGIGTISSQNVVDGCFQTGDAKFCNDLTRVNGALIQVDRGFINIAQQIVSGIDFESSYRMDLFSGELTLHGNGTLYLKNYSNNTFSPATDHVGDLAGVPDFRALISASYKQAPWTFGLTARGVTSQVINNTWIECTSGCPASTADARTIDNNQYPGAIYLDMNVQYEFNVGAAKSNAYFSVRNLLDTDPKPDPTTANYGNLGLGVAGLYDVNGMVFRAGLRFAM